MLKEVEGKYFTVTSLEDEIFSIVREYTDLYVNREELKELIKLAQIILDNQNNK